MCGAIILLLFSLACTPMPPETPYSYGALPKKEACRLAIEEMEVISHGVRPHATGIYGQRPTPDPNQPYVYQELHSYQVMFWFEPPIEITLPSEHERVNHVTFRMDAQNGEVDRESIRAHLNWAWEPYVIGTECWRFSDLLPK